MRALTLNEVSYVSGGWNPYDDPLHPDLGLPGQGRGFGSDDHSQGPNSSVSGGSMVDAAVTTAVGFAYGSLLVAGGLEEGAATVVTAVVAYTVHELPELPPPTEGGAFYVHKQ